MISLFMQGGPSHIDLFDPKPELTKRHLQNFTGDIKYDNAAEASAKLFASPWKFSQHGQCGMELSRAAALPGRGRRRHHAGPLDAHRRQQPRPVDQRPEHRPHRPPAGRSSARGSPTPWAARPGPARLRRADRPGGPAGARRRQLVERLAAVALPGHGRPPAGAADSEPRSAAAIYAARLSSNSSNYLQRLNAEHLASGPGENDLAARIASYELAARMQTAAKEALDISQETAATHRLYGLDDPDTTAYGTRCLIARRLVERGVRFVQIPRGNQTGTITAASRRRCRCAASKVDRPTAALVQDLKQRGLLDTTLVHWGGEMGRLPVVQNEKNIGRDHNTYGFSMWLAGGGIKGGYVHGATDEFGHKAVENVVTHYDYHATLLHLFGLDPRTLTFQRPSGLGSLIDGQPARIVNELLT